MFKPTQYDSGKLVTMKQATNATVAKGDALTFASGYVQRAVSGTTKVRYVAMQDQVSTSDTPDLLCLEVEGVRFEVDTTGNMSQAYVGTVADLTDHDTLNEDAVAVHVFFIEGIVGATTDKKAVGYFVAQTA